MKIAILGTENSHARAFAQLIRDNAKYQDVELIGVYGYDAEANYALVDEGLAPRAATSPDEFLGEVDGVIVTARHGALHREYALPYVLAGVPAFIDKPFAITQADITELIDAAKASGALLCGGSSLKFLDELNPLKRFVAKGGIVGGHVTAPVSMVNEYGGFYFYAQHLIEIMFAVFGSDIRSVCARRPDAAQNRVSAVFDYGDYDVTAQFYDAYTYTATAYSHEGCLSAVAHDVTYCYDIELSEFCDMMRTGRMPEDYDRLARPARLLGLIERAYLEQREVMVQW